ncbi:MAG: hypothetical protein IKP32_06955 [Clostridia bacterium]|nr:hypothetical protein [Clostridia bacterium]
MTDHQAFALRGKKVSILGDSYSTFAGCVPENCYVFYPLDILPDVARAEDTWWHQLITRTGMWLLSNNSSSGTTICTSVRPEHCVEDAFVCRMKHSLSRNGIQGETPDLILIFGGTNDSWTDAPLGRLQYENWTEKDLQAVLPAFCDLLHYVTAENPHAFVLNIINTDMKPEIVQGMREACAHYSVHCLALREIDKAYGHPTKLGMTQIADQTEDALNKLFSCE